MVVVFGAGGTVGKDVCRVLSSKMADYQIVAVDMDDKALATLGKELNITHMVKDASAPGEVKQVFDKFGKDIYGVVNCIGDFVSRSLTGVKDYEFDEIIKTNVVSMCPIVRGATFSQILLNLLHNE